MIAEVIEQETVKEYKPFITIDSNELIKGFELVKYAASTDKDNFSLRAVNFRAEKTLTIEGLDGHRFTQYEVPGNTCSIHSPYTAFTLVLDDVKKLIKILPKNEIVYISKQKLSARFEWDNVAFTGELCEIEFPRLDYLTPRQFQFAGTIAVDRVALLNVLKSLKPVKKEFLTNVMSLRHSLGTLSLKTTEGELTIPAKLVGQEIELSLNSEFLLDAIKGLTGKTIVISFNGPKSPILLRCSSAETLSLIMPIQVRE